MNYNLMIGGSQVMGGNILMLLALLAFFVTIIVIASFYIRKRLKSNEVIKYEFITIVAHKFRTPLTHIKWLCDNLISSEQDSFKKQSIQDIMSSNQKLIDLTGTLIEMVDAQSDAATTYSEEKISLCELVRHSAASFKESFHEKNLFFSVVCAEDEIFVNGDRIRLEFAIRTVIENACIYTPPGKNVEISVTTTGNKAAVSVTDEGIGIAKQDLPNIFLKFFRAENARKVDTEGFGVGLYLSRSVIQRLGGKIEVFSEGENKGSTFKIILPRSR